MDDDQIAVTVWKDGTWKAWGAMDAFYAQNDPDFLVNIGLVEARDMANMTPEELAEAK